MDRDVTLEDLSYLVLDPKWMKMEKYLEQSRLRHVNALILSEDDRASQVLRGRIRELDTLLRLRSQVITEREAKR